VALHPLFQLGSVPGATQQGYRSLLAFWSGGASNNGQAAQGFRSLLAFWSGGAATTGEAPPAAVQTDLGDGGRRRRGRRQRLRTADDDLTEGEVQWMQRKLAELRKAKSEREAAEAAKALEIALAQAAQDERAAEVISEVIEAKKPEAIARADYSLVMRDVRVLGQILSELLRMVKAYEDEEDDIEILLLGG
jgi:hypothetical protein